MTMGSSHFYNQFRIDIRPSPETNDHEVRFFTDGEDVLARFWKGMIGLDPEDILVSPCPLYAGSQPHQATVARCHCGVIGCGSIEVEVARSLDRVQWSWGHPESRMVLSILATSYDAEVQRALTDTSWETSDRTVARLLADRVDRQMLASYGLSFTWASGRVRKGAFSVSLRLEPGPYQILLHLPWNGESPEGIAQNFAELLSDQPANWFEAEWFPQRAGLAPPLVAGLRWRRGR